ncbi:DUF3466 family protein [Aliagarivorans taiwanensis]|uniref:DUF3466 family protein n=1 Tax=Aliagarivorans taiwanensis TaxID=561966 RepID=UPI00047D9782|nr:DUF3466 family protein [Aliagarivorans taiwanensis]
MKKTFVASALGLILSQQVVTAHAANIEPYYLVEEIPIVEELAEEQAPEPYLLGLEDARYDFNVTAVSDDGTLVAGRALTFFTYFTFFDFFDRTTFDYGCQYSSDVCDNYNYSNYGFYEFYREAHIHQRSRLYESKILAYWADLSGSPAIRNSGSNVEPVPVWPVVDEKLYVFDDPTSGQATTDTQINDIQRIDGHVWLTGWDSAPYYLNDSSNYVRDHIGRGFAKNASTGAVITLAPCNQSLTSTDECDVTRLNGGASVGAKFVFNDELPGYEGRTVVVGFASYRYLDNSSSYFNDCQRGNRDYYSRCSGFDTQVWIWDITDAADGDLVFGEQLVDGYDLARYGASRYNVVNDIGSRGTMVGMSSRAEYDSRTGSRGRATKFVPNSDTAEVPYTTIQIPNLRSDNHAPNTDKYRDTVMHTWATAVNDVSRLIVGNLRFSAEKGRNRPVEGFVYEDDGSNTVAWPFRNLPQRGSNSHFSDVNANSYVVGWRDADGEEQPSYRGTTRRQTGFILDYNAYKSGAAVSSWNLIDLTCYESDAGEAMLPLYRIEYPQSIEDDGTVIASGYHYANANDFINRTNPRPVLLRLTVNPNGDLANLAQCPQLEEQPSERSGGAMAWWSLLLLLPIAFVRQFKFTKNATKA